MGGCDMESVRMCEECVRCARVSESEYSITFGHKLLIDGSDNVSEHVTIQFSGDHSWETCRRNRLQQLTVI